MTLQTIDRAVMVLKILGENRQGLRFTDIQKLVGLTKPTTHRLLLSLESHNFVQHDGASRLYKLGRGLDTLSWMGNATGRDLKQICMPSVLSLAELSGDTVFFVVRDRQDTVCIARESGTYPIRAITVDVGSRRPLGVGAGGLAILSSLGEEERNEAFNSIKERLSDYRMTSAQTILKSIEITKAAGYSFSENQVVKGVSGVAVAIRTPKKIPIAAIGIAAIDERLRPKRLKQLVELLLKERKTIEALFPAET